MHPLVRKVYLLVNQIILEIEIYF